MSTPSIRAALEQWRDLAQTDLLCPANPAETDWAAVVVAIAATRAALAQPEGEGPSVEDLALVYHECCRGCEFMDQGGFEDAARAILAHWGRPAALPAPEHAGGSINDDQREAVRAAVAEALGGAYDCTRVWEAWQVGTMGSDDFVLVAEDDDRVAEIADAAIEAMRPTALPVPEAGEVGELVAALEQDADRGEQFYDLCNTTATQFARAAELLQQQESRIAKLRSALAESGRAVGSTIGNKCSDSFLLQVPQEVRLAMRKAAPAPAVVPVPVVYDAGDGISIHRVSQAPEAWAVRRDMDCLALDGTWSYEPMPSSRTEEWLARHRFTSAEAAAHAIPLPQAGEGEA
jgi:hypothetical protein